MAPSLTQNPICHVPIASARNKFLFYFIFLVKVNRRPVRSDGEENVSRFKNLASGTLISVLAGSLECRGDI